MSIPTSEFDRVVRERNRVEAERNALRAAIQAADERAKRQRGIITRLTDENETLSWQIAAVETVRRNLADAMRLGGDAGHVMDGRWILRRLDEVLPLAAAGVDREDTEQPLDATRAWEQRQADIERETERYGHEMFISTGQADEPQRQWGGQLTHMPDPYKAAAGQVVPQQPAHVPDLLPCTMNMGRCIRRSHYGPGRVPGPVGQDTTGGDE